LNIFIRNYIEKITEQDIYNFALKEGITLLNDESKIIYTYIKNYWQVLLEDDATFVFEELKEKLRPKTYKKVLELYTKYKTQFKK